jgi:hypothetical protein
MTSLWMMCREKRGATCYLETCESSSGKFKNGCHVSTQEKLKRYMCPTTCAFKRFRKSCEQTPSGFRVSEFLLLRLIEISEARSSEATVRDLPLLKFRRLQNSRGIRIIRSKGKNSSTSDIVHPYY